MVFSIQVKEGNCIHFSSKKGMMRYLLKSLGPRSAAPVGLLLLLAGFFYLIWLTIGQLHNTKASGLN